MSQKPSTQGIRDYGLQSRHIVHARITLNAALTASIGVRAPESVLVATGPKQSRQSGLDHKFPFQIEA